MSLEIYKKGQGKVARSCAYAIIGVLVAFGAIRFHAAFNVPGEGVLVESVPVIGSITILKVAALALFLVGLLAMHVVLNGGKLVDMLIDTEQEMRKVSWPSWPEVKSATLVVVAVTFILGASLFGFDRVLRGLFSFIF